MAGYDFALGMSNNAVAAYHNGLVPASKIAGVPAYLTQKFCTYEEWHHSSKNFNVVNFYDPEYVRCVFGLAVSDLYDAKPEAVAALAAYKASGIERYENCRVEWIEWTGTLRRPTANHRAAEACTVEVKKQTAIVTFADGRTMTKRVATKGFYYTATK